MGCQAASRQSRNVATWDREGGDGDAVSKRSAGAVTTTHTVDATAGMRVQCAIIGGGIGGARLGLGGGGARQTCKKREAGHCQKTWRSQTTGSLGSCKCRMAHHEAPLQHQTQPIKLRPVMNVAGVVRVATYMQVGGR